MPGSPANPTAVQVRPVASHATEEIVPAPEGFTGDMEELDHVVITRPTDGSVILDRCERSPADRKREKAAALDSYLGSALAAAIGSKSGP